MWQNVLKIIKATMPTMLSIVIINEMSKMVKSRSQINYLYGIMKYFPLQFTKQICEQNILNLLSAGL